MQVSTVAEYGLTSCNSQVLEHRPNSCGTPAKLFHGMWDLPRPGIEPMAPALAGRFFTCEPPGKPTIAFKHYTVTEWGLPWCRTSQGACNLVIPGYIFLQGGHIAHPILKGITDRFLFRSQLLHLLTLWPWACHFLLGASVFPFFK